MAPSIHPYYPPRAESAPCAESPQRASPVKKAGLDSSRSLAGMLLASVVAALLVVADKLIDTWADGHLLVVWVALWTGVFTALALMAPPLRQLTDVIARVLNRWSVVRARRNAEKDLWAYAQQDYRVMRDLQVASSREEAEA
ncbi:MAG: hypothetical protein KAX88_08140 [Rhodoferax sp.]|nr:hypothetical protein [Rhodoferax sp.]